MNAFGMLTKNALGLRASVFAFYGGTSGGGNRVSVSPAGFFRRRAQDRIERGDLR